MPFLPPNQQRQSTEGNHSINQSINQSIIIRVLRHCVMQSNNLKQKGNAVT